MSLVSAALSAVFADGKQIQVVALAWIASLLTMMESALSLRSVGALVLGRLGGARRRPHNAGLSQRRRDLLHAIDQFDGRRRRQHQAAGRITAAGDRRIGSDFVETRDPEIDTQRLTIEDQPGDGI